MLSGPAADLPLEKELLIAAANLINAEEHLVYSLPKTPGRFVNEVKDLINEVRAIRSRLMRMAGFGSEGGELWCAAKHLLAASYRMLEAAEKAAKKPADQNPDSHAPAELSTMSRDLVDAAFIILDLQQEMRKGEEGR